MESEVYSASFDASLSDGLTADSSTFVVAHELKAPLSLMRQLALSLDYEDDIAESSPIFEFAHTLGSYPELKEKLANRR